MIRVLGTGFREPPDPLTLTHDDPVPGPTVRVQFGGVAATYVAVINESLMYVRVPASSIRANRDGDASGAVDVVVTNLDDAGTAIGGETSTKTNAFTYRYTKLTGESSLVRIMRVILRAMSAQIYPNVVYMGHPDYDDDTSDGLNLVAVAKLPSLAVIGPRIRENRFQTINTPEYVEAQGHVVIRRQAYIGDLTFTVIGTTDNTRHALNLQAETISFFKRFIQIEVARDPADAAAGTALYDVVIPTDGPASIDATSDDSALRTFSHQFMIRGYPIQGLQDFADSSIGALEMTDAVGGGTDDIVLTVLQREP